MDVFLDHLGHALGDERRELAASVAAGLTVSSAGALAQAGFAHHHVCAPGTTAYDLALRACAPLRPHLDGTDAIVYNTTLPENANLGDAAAYQASRDVKHLMVFPGSRLQAALDLPRAQVVGLTQMACTGMLGAIRVARGLIAAEGLEKVLCLTADRFPAGARYEQAYNLISDGAAACVVTRAPGAFRVLGGHAVTNGALALASDDQTMGSFFTYSHRVVTETLARAGVALADVRWIVAQNTNLAAWRVLASLLKIDLARVCYPTLPEAAHVISGDNLINLAAMAADGKIARGDKLLLLMAGYGLNWQTLLLERT
jgi:3-oxoacyl-[acyl-carrier-protein] synthase-3